MGTGKFVAANCLPVAFLNHFDTTKIPKINTTEMRMSRWMCSCTRMKKIVKENVHQQEKVALIEDKGGTRNSNL